MLVKLLRTVLSGWFLVFYFGLGTIFFFVFANSVSWIGYLKSFTVTMGLLTGSDPYSFKEIMEPHVVVWVLAWIIHVASWLFVPALIALVITDAKVDMTKERNLNDGLDQLARELGIKEEKIPEVRNMIRGEVEEWIRGSNQKGA